MPVTHLLNYQDDEIQVKVTNGFNEDIAPLTADFTFFGGIYRNIDLMITEPVHFSKNDHGITSGVYLTTPVVSKEIASIKIKSIIANALAEGVKVQVHTDLTDAEGLVVATNLSTLTLPAHQNSTIVQDIKNVKNPQLWSPENPYLYRVITQIIDVKTKTVLDQVSNPLGFRWFKFDAEKGFSLNGEHLKLIGASRHQDYKDMGNAVPDALQIRDVELLKKMGGNFLRVSHYPQDPQVLEACDRLGILASVEIPVVNTITESAAFTENCKNMQVEMIRQNFNHPSVVIWAYMNEILLRPKFADDKARQAVYFKHIVSLHLRRHWIA
ncbi:glycoside hydrolase family 2 protein [Pedobacter sp. NJ-S-72]